MKILMTGITGFIGRHLALQLQADSHEVIGLARSPLPDSPHKLLAIDLAEPFDWERRLPGAIDTVIHLAQGNTSRSYDMLAVNVAATDHLVKYAEAAGASLFVFASTGNVYRPSENWLLEESPLDDDTTNYYVLTKITGERFARRSRNAMSVLVTRIFTPYGAGQVERMIPRLIERVRIGQPITLVNGGQPSVNPIHISDLVEILRTLVKRKQSGIYNIGGPAEASVFDICDEVAKILEVEFQREEKTSPQRLNLLGNSRRVYKDATWTPHPFPYGLAEMVEAAAAAAV